MVSQPSSPESTERLGCITPDFSHDYKAIMKYCQDERNWFKRARGEWDEDVSPRR